MPALTQRSVTLTECGTPVSSCTPGYTCMAASLSTRANPCGPGLYSPAGSSVCIPCPEGSYNNVTAAGLCVSCPAGRYGSVSALSIPTCTDACPAGRFGVLGANSSACTAPCEPGRWGALGESSSQCSGACSAGYVPIPSPCTVCRGDPVGPRPLHASHPNPGSTFCLKLAGLHAGTTALQGQRPACSPCAL